MKSFLDPKARSLLKLQKHGGKAHLVLERIIYLTHYTAVHFKMKRVRRIAHLRESSYSDVSVFFQRLDHTHVRASSKRLKWR